MQARYLGMPFITLIEVRIDTSNKVLMKINHVKDWKHIHNTSSCRCPDLCRLNLKYHLFDLNLSLIEFVCNKCTVSPLIKPYFMLNG